MLAPHLSSPRTGPDAIDVERMILNAGIYNVGVLGVARRPQARAMLDWWAQRTEHDCALAIERGVHYEQRWLTLAPALFDGVHVDRDPGTCIGHWSIPDTRVELVDGVPHADGRPIVALRFSGFDGDRPDEYSRYAPRLASVDRGDLDKLVDDYADRLVRAGHADRCTEYAYGPASEVGA